MKTLGRLLVIVTVAVLIAVGLYFLVTANASNLTSGGFPRGEEFRPGELLPALAGQRPEGSHSEGSERGEFEGGWIFGVIKNVGVIAILVTIIVWPSSLRKKKRLANFNPREMKGL